MRSWTTPDARPGPLLSGAADVEAHEFLRRHPRLYHLAHADAWPSLQAHGLMSTAWLVRNSSLDKEEQQRVLGERRPQPLILDVAEGSAAVLPDQAPFNAAKLDAALTDGMTAAEWMELLNSLVFLFPDVDGLAAAYEKQKAEPVVVLEIEGRSLVNAYGSLVRLASINSASTVYAAGTRGRETFRGIKHFDSKRKVKEVAVLDGIPDLAKHVIKAERWEPDGTKIPLS